MNARVYYFALGVAVATLFSSRLLAALPPPDTSEYRERQMLNPDTDEWKTFAPEPEGTPGGDLAAARADLISGQPGDAKRRLKKWLKEYPDDARYYQAVMLLGEAYFEEGDYYAAYVQFEQVVENSSGDLFRQALLREMDCSRAFLAGKRRIIWGFLPLPAYDDGVEILDRVWERVPGTRTGENALKLKADYYFFVGDHGLAQDEYTRMVTEYPNGRFTRYAMLRAAESAERAFPGPKFDDRALIDADDRYKQVQEAYPQYAERERIQQRRAGIREQRAVKDLDTADFYERTRKRDAAIFYYKLVLKDWPDTQAATQAQTRLRVLGVAVEGGQASQTQESL